MREDGDTSIFLCNMLESAQSRDLLCWLLNYELSWHLSADQGGERTEATGMKVLCSEEPFGQAAADTGGEQI